MVKIVTMFFLVGHDCISFFWSQANNQRKTLCVVNIILTRNTQVTLQILLIPATKQNLVKKLTRIYMVGIYFLTRKNLVALEILLIPATRKKPGQKCDSVVHGGPILLTNKNQVGPFIRWWAIRFLLVGVCHQIFFDPIFARQTGCDQVLAGRGDRFF